jgi:uncharacterized protein (DUF362 family)
MHWAMKNKTDNRIERKAPMTRRDFIAKTSTALGISAGLGYFASAPENWPFSLTDPDGLRSLPRPDLFSLKDFRIEVNDRHPVIGIGRQGTTEENLRKALDALGGIQNFVKPGDRVLLKPNAAFDRSPGLGATTHPDIIGALTRMLLVDCRAAEVRVTDNPIESPADCFEKNGIRKAVETAGGRIFLPDSNAFRSLQTPDAVLIKEWDFLARPFKNVNKVIGLAPVKDHNLCGASLGIKNWYGLLGGRRNQFHQDIHEIISDLSLMIRPTLTILDGTRVLMRNGPTGGNPADVKRQDIIIAGTDPVALDAWAFQVLLERNGNLPDYIHRAEKKGGGKADFRNRVREIV